MTRRLNVLSGLITGPVLVFLFYSVISVFAQRKLDFYDEAVFMLFQIAWTSLPFVIIMLHRVTSIWPWATATVLTIVLHAYVILEAAETVEAGKGVNIGLGILMFAWPLIVTAVAVIIIAMTRSQRD